ATQSELRGEQLFFGKAQCSTCHPAPFYLDNQMHDLRVERFLKGETGDGPIKSFTLRGIKESPPYLHDGRLLTLADTVEFFNLVLEVKPTSQESRTWLRSCGSSDHRSNGGLPRAHGARVHVARSAPVLARGPLGCSSAACGRRTTNVAPVPSPSLWAS